jgi:hypothetical protein
MSLDFREVAVLLTLPGVDCNNFRTEIVKKRRPQGPDTVREIYTPQELDEMRICLDAVEACLIYSGGMNAPSPSNWEAIMTASRTPAADVDTEPKQLQEGDMEPERAQEVQGMRRKMLISLCTDFDDHLPYLVSGADSRVATCGFGRWFPGGWWRVPLANEDASNEMDVDGPRLDPVTGLTTLESLKQVGISFHL